MPFGYVKGDFVIFFQIFTLDLPEKWCYITETKRRKGAEIWMKQILINLITLPGLELILLERAVSSCGWWENQTTPDRPSRNSIGRSGFFCYEQTIFQQHFLCRHRHDDWRCAPCRPYSASSAYYPSAYYWFRRHEAMVDPTQKNQLPAPATSTQ